MNCGNLTDMGCDKTSEYLLERLRNHVCTGTCTCGEVLNPVIVILKEIDLEIIS